MKSRKRYGLWWALFFGVIIAVAAVAFLKVPESKKIPSEVNSRAIPEMKITLGETTLEEIRKNGKDIKYLGNDLELTIGDQVQLFSDVEVKGRGNFTWGQEKKPLQIKLSEKADLLGLGERRKWILLANYVDATKLRTDTAFYLEKMLGESFGYSGEFVALYIDDEYEGLYYLTRGIEIRKNAVDLRDPLGVLMELDNIYCQREDLYFKTKNGECFTVKDAVNKDSIELAAADFLESFNQLEESIKQQDYGKILSLIDVESFAQYYLIAEFSINNDAYFTSQYFYKDGPSDKIYAGPAWDFDIALNNYLVTGEKAFDADFTDSIGVDYLDKDKQVGNWSRLFARLIRFPEFRDEVNKVFQSKLKGRKYELLWHVFTQAARIYSEAMKDAERWGKEGYVKDVKKLLTWLNMRYDYLEEEYGTKKHKNFPFYGITVVEV